MVTIPEHPKAKERKVTGYSGLIVSEPSFLPLRISTYVNNVPNGADISMTCFVGADFYFCKADRDGRNIRATEWFATKLADHLGFATAPCAIIENDKGETFFGSLNQASSAKEFKVRDFLITPQSNELGQPSIWLGQYLARLLALDLFLNNPDRSMRNFLLISEGINLKLCAIDFAAVCLGDMSGQRFPVANSPTIKIGKIIRAIHGDFRRSMIEMVDLIAAVPPEIIRTFIAGMPEDWLAYDEKTGICDRWAGAPVRDRLSILRSGIEGGTVF